MRATSTILAFLGILGRLAAAEPYVEIKMPVRELPEGFGNQGWRMTVEPGKSDFVLAKFQEFRGVRNPKTEDRAEREVTRLIWTNGSACSEDVILSVFHNVRTKDDDPIQELSILRCFGQEFRARRLFLRSSGGFTSRQSIVRHFRFADKLGDDAKWHTIDLTFKVIDRLAAEAIAREAEIELPSTGTATWAITVPPTPKAIVEQAGAGQPATRSELNSEGVDKPQPESEGRPR